jgi:hypothetical protein
MPPTLNVMFLTSRRGANTEKCQTLLRRMKSRLGNALLLPLDYHPRNSPHAHHHGAACLETECRFPGRFAFAPVPHHILTFLGQACLLVHMIHTVEQYTLSILPNFFGSWAIFWRPNGSKIRFFSYKPYRFPHTWFRGNGSYCVYVRYLFLCVFEDESTFFSHHNMSLSMSCDMT